MTGAAEHLLDQAMRLSPEERSELTLRLLDTLGEASGELERPWIALARSRLAELDAGTGRRSPWVEARERIFANR